MLIEIGLARLQRLRERCAIPRNYQIQLELRCPSEMPHAFAFTSWDYLANRQFIVRLRCDLSEEEIHWVLAHELMEILLADYAELSETAINEGYARNVGLRQNMHRRHAVVRDQAIEWLLQVILGHQRPMSLMTEAHP